MIILGIYGYFLCIRKIAFVQFQSLVENMFSTKIKAIKTGEGKELVNR